ncbi:GNAT family N-acetyltransferase [Fulvivirga ligni]|uniref:GNAT family N-acetyltransferase n=1 Tax=Fulvivirga ligni TaxID=2904246 RepID=UPI001F2CBC31|nr:GNAT family N-acetyltransferase [Fulvivirga ligni]UII19032.1 GNAT family N-acetyltransferase [Fulvivirga ligni]
MSFIIHPNNNRKPAFRKHINGIGVFELYTFDVESESKYIHQWVNQDYAKYWGMQNTSLDQVKSAYQDIVNDHTQVFMAYYNNAPIFLLEWYDPLRDVIGKYYDVQRGDAGMHILIAPPKKKIAHFTWHVFTTIMDFIFSDEEVSRIVVEPDIRNEKIHVLNKKAGFQYDKPLDLPHKTAHLAFCTRANYNIARSENDLDGSVATATDPAKAVTHLNTRNWSKANSIFIRKAIGEFTHELILQPKRFEKGNNGYDHYALSSDKPGTIYYFRARKLALDHWSIDETSITKKVNDETAPLDGLSFILDFKNTLGIPAEMLPTYLEEIASTLYGSAYMRHTKTTPVEELIHASYQQIEHAMTAGHPCFVANNGRIGFDTVDYKKYAPEADTSFQLIWLAGHKEQTNFSHISDLTYNDLLATELGDEVLNQFNDKLNSLDVNADEYYFIPVHPWQWFNKLASIFSPDIANKRLIYLGKGGDQYLAQQSIRTLYNISEPTKFYVKTSLSILNMGFMRGLSPYYMKGTPAITEWVNDTLGKDQYLKEQGFEMLGEVATIGYRNFYFEELGRTNAYNKMLSALWRESPSSELVSGQTLMTMAALLHVDEDNRSLAAELINASDLSVEEWLQSYLKCYMKPLLHCFYKYDTVFMPHGENLILVIENNVPVKAIMKDITEEMQVLSSEVALSGEVKRIFADVPENIRLLSIFTDIFDCFFRFLSAILEEQEVCVEDTFWNTVAVVICEYQQEWPQYEKKFLKYDLFTEEFDRSCLNRLQLKNNKQMVNLADPAAALQFFGKLKNPVAAFRKVVMEGKV